MLGDVYYSGKSFMRSQTRPTVVATGKVISWLRPVPLGLGGTRHKSQKREAVTVLVKGWHPHQSRSWHTGTISVKFSGTGLAYAKLRGSKWNTR